MKGKQLVLRRSIGDRVYRIQSEACAGAEGMIISNDEMRDHIFQMLAPKFFLKWKQRHQVGMTDAPSSLRSSSTISAVKHRCCSKVLVS